MIRVYRLTRNQLGDHPIHDRQGYYIQAKNEDEAIEKMRDRFPLDTEGFTVQVWR